MRQCCPQFCAEWRFSSRDVLLNSRLGFSRTTSPHKTVSGLHSDFVEQYNSILKHTSRISHDLSRITICNALCIQATSDVSLEHKSTNCSEITLELSSATCKKLLLRPQTWKTSVNLASRPRIAIRSERRKEETTRSVSATYQVGRKKTGSNVDSSLAPLS